MITPYPKTLYVGSSSIEEYAEESWDEIARDPRGLLLMWEPPTHNSRYIMGLDPTVGITGWNRGTRTNGDHKVDNGAIEIFKVDGYSELVYKIEGGEKLPDIDPVTKRQRRHYKDVQVAEFAAPCDAVEIARVASVLGRIYAGEEEQCELIWEAYPGPGILTTQELLRLGYTNLWMWQYIDSLAEDTNRMGWRSFRESQRMLWNRSRRHLMQENVIINSRFLLDEYSKAEVDTDKMRARAAYGMHDDRLQAANMCFWAAHKWAVDVERAELPVTESQVRDYQSYAPTFGDSETFADWKVSATEDWE